MSIISKATVRLRIPKSENFIGSGILLYQKNFREYVYILTAYHCIESVSSQSLFESLGVDIFNEDLTLNQTIEVKVKDAVFDKENDIAIIPVEYYLIEKIVGIILNMKCISNDIEQYKFTIKGYPRATKSKEIDCINPEWKQNFGNDAFQLSLNEDYLGWSFEGFSGSGVFIEKDKRIYLTGFVSKFREEEKGKVIYCQKLLKINDLLRKKFLPEIKFDFASTYGFDNKFFMYQVERSIENLGTRYDNILNLQLPIAQRFNDLVKDEYFRHRFLKSIDLWLLGCSGKSNGQKEELLLEIKNEIELLRQKVNRWVQRINFNELIQIDWLYQELSDLDEKVEEQLSKFRDLKYEEWKKDNVKKRERSNISKELFRAEINWLNSILYNNSELRYNLNERVNIKLANHPSLILKGGAGSGKSHLLGDIAKSRIDRGLPTLLFLGQEFKNTSIWDNILGSVGCKDYSDRFLQDLDNIGKQIGSRVLILIDAINEGAGKELWASSISGFINEISKYTYIGLVLSIRSTYFDIIIPNSIQKNDTVSIIEHQGFKGNEYAALKLFCDYHEIKQPNFPILTPDFSNPLFLLLTCKSVQQTPEKKFPQGFQGVSLIFNEYINALNKTFFQKPEYNYRNYLIKDVINDFVLLRYEKNEQTISIQEIVNFFDEKFSKFPNLLNDLIQENVLIKDYNYYSKTEEIHFAFERFADYNLASLLLERINKKEDIIAAFQPSGEFGKLFTESYYLYSWGLFEAFSFLLPERYDLEIFEVFHWLFVSSQDSERDRIQAECSTICSYFLKGLNWRRVESVNYDKIAEWMTETGKHYIDNEQWFLSFFELCSTPNHPFNAKKLSEIFNRFKMPQRDSFLQNFIIRNSGEDDYGTPLIVDRLIDWAWINNISNNIDFETARLTGATLAWFLSSTNEIVRDRTTKSMVNLLEQQPDALIAILNEFSEIDDMYISERLYAVAYGVTLRTNAKKSIGKIAEYTYRNVFENRTPLNNILLRDYARNIIEFALYNDCEIEVEEKSFRPPYASKLPSYPLEEEIKEFDKFDLDSEYGRLFNRIYFDTIEWDFGNKTVENTFHNFHHVRFTFRKEFQEFKRGLNKGQKDALKGIELAVSYDFINKSQLEEKEKKIILRMHKELIELIEQKNNSYFSKKQMEFISNKLRPYYEEKEREKNWQYRFFITKPIKRWIVKRVFDLGYDMELHGSFDKNYTDWGGKYYNNAKRIGEKYQMIAYYEILAIVADNYKVNSTRAKSGGANYYEGPWQFYLRNIDPAYLKQNIEVEDEFEDDLGLISKKTHWMENPAYKHWNLPNDLWAFNLDDLPKMNDIILRTDENGKIWLNLQNYLEWREPKPIGEEKYFRTNKRLVYILQAYLVRKTNKTKIINYLSDKNLFGRWMPENFNDYSNLFNREKFWSPAYKYEKERVKWKTIEGTSLKIQCSATIANGRFEKDKSNASLSYQMPCETIFRGLGLQYDSDDGNFIDNFGEVIVRSHGNNSLFVRMDKFKEFLNEKRLEIIWTVLGEKIAEDRDDEKYNSFYHFGVPCGVFYLDDQNNIKGSFNMYDRND